MGVLVKAVSGDGGHCFAGAVGAAWRRHAGAFIGEAKPVARYRFRLEAKTPAGLGWGGRLGSRGRRRTRRGRLSGVAQRSGCGGRGNTAAVADEQRRLHQDSRRGACDGSPGKAAAVAIR